MYLAYSFCPLNFFLFGSVTDFYPKAMLFLSLHYFLNYQFLYINSIIQRQCLFYERNSHHFIYKNETNKQTNQSSQIKWEI